MRRKRVHNWGPWKEHTPTEYLANYFFFRNCLDCGESEHLLERYVCDIR